LVRFTENQQIHFLKAVNELVAKRKCNKKIKFIVLGTLKANPLYKVLIKKILGKKDYGYEFHKYLTKNKLQDYVDILPMLYLDKFYSLLNEIDIYIRPSLAGDPWGRDIIEAMAFGKPVIATGESEFYIQNNKSGFLVSPGNPHEMADKIYKLISNEKLRKKMEIRGMRL